MKNKMLFLPDFYLQTLHRSPRSEQQILADKKVEIKRKSFSELGRFLGKYIPAKPLKQEGSGKRSRRRIYSKENTFWEFFSQVLDSDGGCREVVRKIQVLSAVNSK